MMDVIRAMVARLFSLIATIATPSIQRALERWATNIEGDVPRIGSGWVIEFCDPTDGKDSRPRLIDAQLHQFGRRVTGVGHIQGEPGDSFRYDGFIRRNVYFGSFRREDSHTLAGTGTFVLKIAANSRQMAGRCTWYESRIDDVWSSEYVWLRRN